MRVTALDMLAAVARVTQTRLTVEIDTVSWDVWTVTLGSEHAGGFSSEEAAANLIVKLLSLFIRSGLQKSSDQL